MSLKVCESCSKPIRGRSDKRYCNNQCRNEYHNRKFGQSTNYMRNINRMLKQNHRVLESLFQEKKEAQVSKRELIKRGFNFNYFTNALTLKQNNVYYFCYDYGYLPIKDSYFALVHRNEYAEP